MKNPKQVLLDNKQLIELVLVHEYLPQISNAHFGAVVAALREINPKASYRTDCSGCIMEIVRMANAYMVEYENELRASTQFKTFPKVEVPEPIKEYKGKVRRRK